MSRPSHAGHRSASILAHSAPLLFGLGCCSLTGNLVHAAEAPTPTEPAETSVESGLFDSEHAPQKVSADIVAPSMRLVDGHWVQYGLAGFSLTADQRHLVGHAIRFDLTASRLFASGDVVLTMPGLRIHAAHLGADGQLNQGEAWDVLVVVMGGRGDMRLRVRHLSFDERLVRLEGVRADTGHGGLFGFGAARIDVHLRDEPNPNRYGAERHLSHITLKHPFLKAGPVPFFYSPYLLRDFNLDYPWTRYEFGNSSRQGEFIRFWTRFDLPLGDWRTRTYGRVDWYNDVGTAVGIRPEWRHDRWGRGEFLWYGFDEEQVRRSNDGEPLTTRYADVLDVEHRMQIPGGAISGRYTELADPDPAPAPVDDRFRADYLERDLNTRPFARQGVTGAWHHGVGGVVLDTEDAAREEDDETNRRFGSTANLPDFALLGPLHANAEGRWEDLEREQRADAAERLRYDAALGLGHWTTSGVGFDLQGGLRGLGYADATRADVELDDDEHRWLPYLEGGSSLRFEARFDNGVKHTITPRIGWEWLGEGQGDELTDFDFDDFDELEEDLSLAVAGIGTQVTKGSRYFRASLNTRWALRSEDSPKADPSDLGDYLNSVDFELAGRPIATLDLDARGRWQGDIRDWDRFDFSGRWIAHQHVAIRATASWRQDDETWQYRPQLTLVGNRYRATMGFTYEDANEDQGGEDRFIRTGVSLTRKMIDGDLSLSYDWVRLEDSDDSEQRFGINFSITGFGLR